MWLWILLTAFLFGHFILVTPEPIGNEFVPDSPNDDSLFLYMDERSFEPPQKENREIEARRRSALDKNFMRFGRSDPNLKNYDYNFDNELDNPEFTRSERSHNKNDNFIRFGRGRNSDFLRFGRDPFTYRDPYIRFGRSVPLKRSRRDVYSTEAFDHYKRANNRDMLRFGRRDNFLRFGRFPYVPNNENQEVHDTSVTNQSVANNVKEKTGVPPEYSTLLNLLTEIALRMRNKDKDTTARIG